MANIKITELQTDLQSVNQVEELSNEDLTSVVGGAVGVGGVSAGGLGGTLFSNLPIVGPLLDTLLGGILGGGAAV